VPYGKAGVAYALWEASNTGSVSRAGDAASGGSVVGSGGSWGTNLAVGVSFVLNALDRSSARSIDNAAGINASHIFVEYYTLRTEGFGQAHPLRLSDNSWAAGLAFEF